jgi:hypothetical protein
MSNVISTLVYGSQPFGQPSRRSVMVALADRANDSGYCFPGIRDLASRTELSGRTILRCILDLEAGGWIQVNRNAVGPLLRGNSYVVDVVKLRECQKAKCGSMAPIGITTRDVVAPVEVTMGTPIGDIDGPLYRKNHHESSVEPKAIARSAIFPTVDGLERVYKAFPRKVAKVAALDAIRMAVARLTSERHDKLTIAEAINFLERKTQSFARSPTGNQGMYTPYPATWFNEGRYEDDESEWGKAKQSKETRGGKGDGSRSYESPAAGRNARSRDSIRNVFAELWGTRSSDDATGADQEQLPISRISRGDLQGLSSILARVC